MKYTVGWSKFTENIKGSMTYYRILKMQVAENKNKNVH